MPTAELAGGATMPMLGFGTWQLRGRSAYQAVRHALDTGYRHIDTATMYGNEAELGRAIRDSGLPREDLFVTTKLPPERFGRERATITESLRALQVEYVDLWLVHWPPRGRSLVPVWRDVLEVHRDGLAHAVGVSNYSLAQLDEITDATGQAPVVNQIPWSPSDHDPDLLAEHRRRGVVVEGYSPLKGTSLRGPVLTEVAAAHQVTPAQVVLRWHLEHDIVVIPKSARPERIETNFDLFGFSLSEAEVARIDALSTG